MKWRHHRPGGSGPNTDYLDTASNGQLRVPQARDMLQVKYLDLLIK